MSIKAIQTQPQAVNFGEGEQQKKKSATMPMALTGLVGGGAIGYFKGEKITAEKTQSLNKDVFEKKFENVKKEKSEVYTELENAKKSNEDITKAADAEVEKVFGKEGKDITVEKYLEGTGAKNKAELEGIITKASEEIKPFETAVTNAETALGKVAKDASETDKAAAKKLVDDAKEALNLKKEALEGLKAKKTLVETAKEDKIARDAFKTAKEAEIKASAIKNIEEAFAKLDGKLPKVNSMKGGLIWAAAGAVILGVVGAMMSGGKKKHSEAQEAPKA